MYKIKPKVILFWILYIVLFEGILIDVIHVPGVLIYCSDLLLFFLLIYTVLRKNNKQFEKEEKVLRNIVLIYMCITAAVYLINYQNVSYYISGFRSVFRSFIFFFLCILYINDEDIEKFWKYLDYVFFLNAFIMLVQYFIFDLEQDYLGGIFGVERGCNGPLNIFFVIIVARSILDYVYKKDKLRNVLIKIALALVLAGFAELKYFFIEFLIMIIFAFLTTKFSFRKLILVMISIAGLVVGIKIIDKLFGMGYTFNINFIIKDSTTGGYSNSNNLSRGAFITVISSRFLQNNFNKIFGLGLGNCDTKTAFAGETPFYRQYGALKYDWFASMHTFIEQGWLGLVFYAVFFTLIFIFTIKIWKKYKIEDYYVKLTCLFSLLFFLVFFYNQTLRQEISYLVMFCLAIPFVLKRCMSEGKNIYDVKRID